jgi:ABC-type sugar transport system permease subunit
LSRPTQRGGVFFFYPLLFAAWQSLHAWDLLTPPRWVGLDNYRVLWRSGELARSLGTTLGFSVVVVVGSTALGLALALALNRPGRFYAFVRGAIFSAYVVSWVSVALLWLWLLDGEAGAVNGLLRGLGLTPQKWLTDPRLAPWSLAAVTIWKIAGYALVLFLAGLQDVPASLYEAAALDGAGVWQRFRWITWPLLRPTTAFVSTTGLIASFQVFDVVRVMTQGGPMNSTNVLVYAIYEQVFMNLRVGRASALIVVFFSVLLALTCLQLLVFRRARAS